VLPEKVIEQVCRETGVDFGQDPDTIFTPAVTLWAFLSQVLFKGEQRSCLAAVSRVIVLLGALSRPVCAKNSGPYCRARAKLSEVMIERLAVTVAAGCEQQVSKEWLWQGRHVKLVDGTTVSMPDTPTNQEAYPQMANQPEGLGFPIARMVLLLSLATAMVCGMSLGPYAGKETGEMALFRRLLEHLEPGDIVLADRYFCSYFMMALLQERGVDVVTRMHQSRIHFRTIKRLGKGDDLVAWDRPPRPDWMDPETYATIPESLTLRQVKVPVTEPGFRAKSLTVVTSLTAPRKYSSASMGLLYRQRWLAELDIRAIKQTMGMDILRCKSPEMVRKEIWSCLLAYNLIRQAMLAAATRHQVSPREMSFTSALQSVAASWCVLPALSAVGTMIGQQLLGLCSPLVGKRPNRVEPRKVKRRPQNLGYLTVPRAEARAALMANGAAEDDPRQVEAA
jgi:hypothetical protein